GTFCALGSLSADFRMDFVQTVNVHLAAPNWKQIAEWFADREAQARRQLDQEMDLIDSVVAVRSGDVRFEGQGFNTEVAMSGDILKQADSAGYEAAFRKRYEQLYGVVQPHVPGELVNIRLTIIGRRQQTPPVLLDAMKGKPSPVGERQVYFDGKRQG